MNLNHIAIIRLSALGDIVNATIVLQFIHERYPHLKIDWITEEVFAPLLYEHPFISQVHTINLKKLKKEKSFSLLTQTIKKLKSLPKYDLIIDMQGLIKSAVIARIVGKNIHGYDKNSSREKLASLFYASGSKIPYEQNVIRRNVALVSDILNLHVSDEMIVKKVPTLPAYPQLSFTEEEYVVLVIGASWPSKIYPKEKFAEIASMLTCKSFIVWGDDKEKADAEFIVEHSKSVQITPKLSLKELCALISHAKLLIGNDTGPTHMAWAYNVPSITIFGPTNERMIYKTSRNIAIHSESKVDLFHLNKNDFSIQNIDPLTVVHKARELLL